MIKRLLTIKLRSYLQFKWDAFWAILNDLTMVLVSVIFWIGLTSLGIFQYNLAEIFLFLFYFSLVSFIIVPFWGVIYFYRNSVRSGKISIYLLYPVNYLITTFILGSWVPVGPFVRMILYFFLSLYFGLKLSFSILTGILLSFLVSVFFISFLFFETSIVFLIEQDILSKYWRITIDLGKYPVDSIKGLAKILLHTVIPAFLFATPQIHLFKFGFDKYVLYAIGFSVLGTLILFSLSMIVFRLAERRYMAYGG